MLSLFGASKMGLFGGGSKSSSVQAVTTNNDNSNQQAQASAIKGNNNTVNVLDGGAIKESMALASNAVKAVENTAESSLGRALDFAESASGSATALAGAALKTVKENSTQSVSKFAELATAVKTDGQAQTTKLIAGVAIALMLSGVAVAWLMNRKKAA